MHCKCSSSPAQSTSLKARTADIFLPVEDNNLLEGINGRRELLCSKSRSNNKLGYNNLGWAGSYDKRDKVSSASSVGCGHNSMRASHIATTKPPQTDVSEEGFPSLLCVKSLNCVVEEPSMFSSKELEGKEGKDGSASESSDSALSLRKCSVESKARTDGANSTKYSLSYIGEHSHKHKRVGCSSTPYEADIGVDMLSLQLRTSSLSPNEKTKLARVFSLHDQPDHRSFSFQTPSTPKPKLGAAQGSTPPLHLFERGMASKRPADQCTFMDPAIFGRRRNAAPPIGFSDREASTTEVVRDFSHRKPLPTQAFNRSYAIAHPQDHTQRDSKAVLPPWSTKHRSYNEFLKPSPSDQKADAFTMHSPLLLKEPSYSEGSGARALNPPMVPPNSKVHWDWRSKSMGAKASLKSAVRNLEATFAGSRSASLPKTRAWAKPKNSKPESTRLLERVFVSPIRARSKQTNFSEPVQRPLLPSRQSNGVKEHGAFWRRDAKMLTSNAQAHFTSACAPGKFVIGASPPNGYKEVEVTCKPFLPASRSVRCLPAPRGALGVESLVFSGQKADGFSSSNALDPTSMLHAQLQCLVKDGLPVYTMIIEGSDEMLFARACWQENYSSKEGFKWQYSFHSGSGQGKARGIGGSGGWRNWIKKESKAISDLSGVMEVYSSTLRHGSALALREGQLLKVLEFILYDGKEAGVAHSQSLRFSSMERRCQKSGLSRGSPSSLSSEHVLSPSPSHLDMDMKHRQHVRSVTELTESSESTSTTSGLHKGNGGHRPGLSLDVWSDSDVPDSVQVPSSCLPSLVELAALVIQVSAEGHQGDSNVSESNHSEGWGLKLLEGGSWPELKSPFSHAHAAAMDALGQGELGTNAEWKPCKRSSHFCAKINRDGFLNEELSAIEEFPFPASPTSERLGMQEGSVDNVTLLLPTGDHGFPNRGTRGPSSLIDRWRSGGSCECGGWDLGCGIKVIRSGSPLKKCRVSNNKHSISCDQQLSLFAQGSKQELMLGLSQVKQGKFRLSFQGQLSPIKAFATAVAMLHSHEPTFLSLASTPASSLSSSSLLPTTPSLMSAPAVEDGSIIYGLKEKLPPRPPQFLHLAAPRRSDSSSKDKISPFLVHNQTFSN